MCVCVCLSLSLQNASIETYRERERERSLSKTTVVQGISAKHPTPRTPLQVSSSRRNFIRAGFVYKLITPEGTSHLLSVCGGGGGGGGGAGYGGTFSLEIHQCCYAPPPPLLPPSPHDTRTYLPSREHFLTLFTGLLIPDHCLSVFTLMSRSC